MLIYLCVNSAFVSVASLDSEVFGACLKYMLRFLRTVRAAQYPAQTITQNFLNTFVNFSGQPEIITRARKRQQNQRENYYRQYLRTETVHFYNFQPAAEYRPYFPFSTFKSL